MAPLAKVWYCATSWGAFCTADVASPMTAAPPSSCQRWPIGPVRSIPSPTAEVLVSSRAAPSPRPALQPPTPTTTTTTANATKQLFADEDLAIAYPFPVEFHQPDPP